MNWEVSWLCEWSEGILVVKDDGIGYNIRSSCLDVDIYVLLEEKLSG